MLDKKYIEILYDIINHYGNRKQVLQTLEEMSELTKESRRPSGLRKTR